MIYIWENDETMLHENDAAEILYHMTAGENMHPSEVKEGKIEVIADSDGLLKVDRERLKKVNSFGELMIAARHGNTAVKKGDKLAGTRIIPLVIKKEKMEKASEICSDAPILKILPFTMKKAAVITTGNEVFYGRIKDGFTPVIEKKINEFGVEMAFHETFNDDEYENVLDNRDPRLRMTICVNEETGWPTWNEGTIYTYQGGANGQPLNGGTPTGYYLKKYCQGDIDLRSNSTNKLAYHTWITYRLGEFYLNYAEAVFRYLGSADGISTSLHRTW